MEARTLERYELLAAWGSALIVALITAVAVPLAAEGAPAAPGTPGTPAAAVVQVPQGPTATR
jgi:hypothetical protein